MKMYPKSGLVLLLSIPVMGILSGCPNTEKGVAEDASNAGQAVSVAAEKTGEAASKAAQKTGQAAAEVANDATKATKNAGQNVAGALQVTPLVKTAITADTELNDPKNKIDVDTKDGVVYLKGHVANNALKAKATKVAEDRIKENHGTDKVMNQLLVQP